MKRPLVASTFLIVPLTLTILAASLRMEGVCGELVESRT